MKNLSIGKNVVLLNDNELSILTKAINILGQCGETRCKDCPFKIKGICTIAHLEIVRQNQEYNRLLLGVRSIED